MAKEWYAPSAIRFWPEHIEWAITYLNMLEQGVWPPEPRETGYTGQSPTHRHTAYFETPVCLAAEVKVRLAMCGPDGKLARKCLADGWDVKTLADLMHTEQYLIERRVRRVVHYCSGWRRRKITFDEFKRRAGIKDNYKR